MSTSRSRQRSPTSSKSQLWDTVKFVPRQGQLYPFVPPPEDMGIPPPGSPGLKSVWPCKDGQIIWLFWSGEVAKRFNPPLIKWMASEGVDVGCLEGFDWENWDRAKDQEATTFMAKTTSAFFLARTCAELIEGAIKHHAMLCPLATTKEIVENPQLAARNFWVELSHPETGAITYPGAFAKSTEAPPAVSRRAPLVGQHSHEVFGEIMGLSEEQIRQLQEEGVI